MASQAMKRRKKEAVSYKSSDYEDYEFGKPRDKAQKKLKDFEEKKV